MKSTAQIMVRAQHKEVEGNRETNLNGYENYCVAYLYTLNSE